MPVVYPLAGKVVAVGPGGNPNRVDRL